MYFLNPKDFNTTVERKVGAHLEKYFEDKPNVEWVLYGSNGEKVLWIPQGRILSGKAISSSSTELILPNEEKVRIFLWIKWG